MAFQQGISARAMRALTSVRISLGVIFLAAAILKGVDLPGFAAQIVEFRILPDNLTLSCAVVIVALEGITALLLLLNRRVRLAAALLGACTLLFTSAMVTVLVRGLSVECNCFGGMVPLEVGLISIGRNSLILGGLLVLATHPSNSNSREARPRARASAP